jgi:hypothetical protein
MSFYDSDTPPSPFSPGRGAVAMGLIQLREDQPGPLEFTAVEQLVAMNDDVYDVEKEIEDGDGKVDNQRNAEQQAFMALPPAGDVGDDNVFSVGAESQFSDSTPRAAGGPNLQTQLTELSQFMSVLKTKITENSEQFFHELQQYMIVEAQDIQVYGNQSIVATLGQNMLVPMLSFYGIATKDVVARSIKPKIGDMKTKIHELTCSQFTTPAGFPDSEVDCTMPTAANMVWNVRLKLNGNIFTLLTFRVVAMDRVLAMDRLVFEPQIPGVSLTPENYLLHLLFALLSKACAKDFNCLCAMPDIDVALFKMIIGDPSTFSAAALDALKQRMHDFLQLLADPQLQSKRSYMITALHNLVANYVDKMIIQAKGGQSVTGETLAYKKLFDGDVSGSGLNTFNPIMNQISQVIKILRLPELSRFGLELQVSLCGGRMIYKLGDVLRSYITQPVASNPAVIAALGGEETAIPLLTEMMKLLNLPSDSDYTLTFAGLSRLEPEFVQTILMFITLCTQLGIKRIVDDFCMSQNPDAAFFLRELVVIGMSLVGGDFQLSSARNSCDALAFLDAINVKDGVDPYPLLTEFLRQFPRDPHRLTKSALAPCDLVPKMNSGDYIRKIANYIFSSGYVDISLQDVMAQIVPNIDALAETISKYSMSTDQGFSSPIKVLFDILFTLFSIENFTNRAFVTQKINKELKRIAICASILFFHFQELLTEYAVGKPENKQITTMLQTLGRVINYGYNPGFKLISPDIHNIMSAYASCFVQLLHLYSIGVVFYSRVPDLTLPAIGGRNALRSLEYKCMDMLRVHAPPPLAQDLVPRQAQEPFQAEGLPEELLQGIITTGVGFLNSIRTRGILAEFLKLKQEVKDKDLQYKARGEFLTSVEAFDLFLRDFVHMLLVPNSPLVALLNPLLQVFRRPELVELMHFQPIVVIKSENLRIPRDDPHGLIVTGEYQFGIYVILSIFGVKFKSEWSKISLFTRMLFYQLLSRADAMHGVCSILLGVDLNKVDPSKMRVSSENFMKDQALFLTLEPCGVVLPLPLQTYYGNDKLRHGIDTYKNSLLDTRQVTYSFIQPIKYDTDEDVLSFQFLNSENLQQLMACPRGAFQRLLPDGFQPRAYEFLLQRLTDKFSILTKECDDNATKELLDLGHSGRPKKELKREFKVRGFDAFIYSVVSDLLEARPVTLDQFNQLMYELIRSLDNNAYAACFKGEEVDISKFRELAPDQCKYWIYHLLEMIMFYHNLSIVRVDLRDNVCVENIKKYSKLLFLLKNYLPIDHAVVQAAVQQAAMQQVAMQQAAIKEASRQQAALPPPASALPLRPRRDRPASPSRGRGANLSPSEGRPPSPREGRFNARSRSPSPSDQGGGSPKASITKTKTKPKTRNNRYSKNAGTRKNKHKRKQHRNRKNKKTKNKKSKSKKNITFKRRRR